MTQTTTTTTPLMALCGRERLVISRYSGLRIGETEGDVLECRVGGCLPETVDEELHWPLVANWSFHHDSEPFAQMCGTLAWNKRTERFTVFLSELDAEQRRDLYFRDRLLEAMCEVAICVARLVAPEGELPGVVGLSTLVPEDREEGLRESLIAEGVEPGEEFRGAWSFDVLGLMESVVDYGRKGADPDADIGQMTKSSVGTLSATSTMSTPDGAALCQRIDIVRPLIAGKVGSTWLFKAMWIDDESTTVGYIHGELEAEPEAVRAERIGKGPKARKKKGEAAPVEPRLWQVRIERFDMDSLRSTEDHAGLHAARELMVLLSNHLPQALPNQMMCFCRSQADLVSGPAFRETLSTWDAVPSNGAPNEHGSLYSLPLMLVPEVRMPAAATAPPKGH